MSTPDPNSNPIAEFFAEEQRRQHLRSEIEKVTTDCSMVTESEILMSAWQFFGDHTETYFEAMQACGAIVAINAAIEKNATGFDAKIIIKILETISLLAASQADCQKKILAKVAEIRGETPHNPKA